MFLNKAIYIRLFALVSLFSLASCSDAANEKGVEFTAKNSLPLLTVYKSKSCGCCQKWIDHIDDNGFISTTHNSTSLSAFKASKGILPRYRSCHTAVSAQGFIFEGHVPAKFIQRFLSQAHSHDVLGLSVPAMPVGTPGMEMADKFMPYQVLLLKADGTSTVYAQVKSSQEQF